MHIKVIPDYHQYIQSEEWRVKREAVFSKYGRACVCCKSKENLHVHHCTYVNLGYEDIADLRPLCKKCHDEVHKLGGGYIGIKRLKRNSGRKRRSVKRKVKKDKQWKDPKATKAKKFTPKLIIRRGHIEIVKEKV